VKPNGSFLSHRETPRQYLFFFSLDCVMVMVVKLNTLDLLCYECVFYILCLIGFTFF